MSNARKRALCFVCLVLTGLWQCDDLFARGGGGRGAAGRDVGTRQKLRKVA